ncbi:M12 family metallopeptidase [Aquimarina sp. MAR_2010_214]|uniref:M12 family metallopeptidase n=1 Tax=Aquimarina sp. MAR_2010_214 TaxID=1250026 RepID=UPI00130405C2|nr:M12 family metallopeptidase [Aquimarina sp. MAR_2010_214]
MKIKKVNALKTLTLGAVLLLASCQKDNLNENVSENSTSANGKTTEKYFKGNLITVKDIGNGEFLYNSDIILSSSMLSDTPSPAFDPKSPPSETNQKLALWASTKKWPNNTIVYKLGSLNSTLRTNLTQAFKKWSDKTNIKFKERTNESDYVHIYESTNVCSGCGRASFGVQRNGSVQLGRTASVSLIVHELGHTLGFVHEQTRSDRDDYVIIKWENIQSGMEGNFKKDQNAQLLTGAFDINSIMMYHSYGFSKNRKPTITLLNGETYNGAQQTISALDIEGTNKAYPSDGGNPSDPCAGVSPWVSGQSYSEGDRITYNGYLYTLQNNSWVSGGKCLN